TEGYRQAADEYGIPLQVNRAGSMVGFFFTDKPVVDYETARTSDLDLFAAYYRGMINEGIFLPPSQFEGVFLSTAHTDEDIELTIEAVHKVLANIKLYNLLERMLNMSKPMNDAILRAYRGEATSYTPAWYMRQAGRSQKEYLELRQKYSLFEITHRPEL